MDGVKERGVGFSHNDVDGVEAFLQRKHLARLIFGLAAV